MGFPIIGAVAIGIGVGSKILGNRSRNKAEKARAEALKGNALVQLANTISGLNAREREELVAAQQQRRLGRRQSAVLESRAKAAGADAGTGSDEQVQDVGLGESEFLGSIDAQLEMVRGDLSRRRKGALREHKAAVVAANSGISGIGQDFLDFANTAAFALNAFDAFPKAKSNVDAVPEATSNG